VSGRDQGLFRKLAYRIRVESRARIWILGMEASAKARLLRPENPDWDMGRMGWVGEIDLGLPVIASMLVLRGHIAPPADSLMYGECFPAAAATQIWVQLGSNKSSGVFLTALKWAVSAVSFNQLQHVEFHSRRKRGFESLRGRQSNQQFTH
jgi:hypothetical protein